MEPDAWRDAVARAQQKTRDRADHRRRSSRRSRHQRDAPPAARAAAARLADPASVAVVTGQQAGVFGGPLYTLLKALTALQLARRTERDLRVPVVAVFWVEAEDHDWEEVRELYGARRRVPAAHRDAGGSRRAPASCRSRSSSWTPASSRPSPSSPPSSSRPNSPPQILADLRAAWKPGTGMARAFATWIETLLGPHGLVVFESADPDAKPLVADVFATELSSPGRTAALAAEAGEALAARGHAPQVVPQPDSVSLFRLNGGRTPIKKQGDQLVIGEATHSSEELAREATATPGAVQPERAAPPDRPGHALPHHLLRAPARASWPTSGSCAASTRRSACRCR